MKFKDILYNLRTEKGLSQAKLAKSLNVSTGTIGMLETGKRMPSVEMQEALADYFNVSLDYLMGRDTKSIYYGDPQEHYYMNDDARELAEFLHKNPDYKVLFDASRKVKREDIEFVKQMIDRMRGTDDDTGC